LVLYQKRQRDGRKTCQRLIYKLITLGIITETPSGTNERPAITISIGNNPSPLSDNSLTIMYWKLSNCKLKLNKYRHVNEDWLKK
jgi:hypothetical protein